MKTLLLILTSLCCLTTIAQTTQITDTDFEQSLINLGYDSGAPDGVVTTANISNITTLDLSANNISDLSGIEDFTSLQVLNCRDNSLTSLDMSQNTSLKTLICADNNITILDVTQNAQLSYLDCDTNNLQTLDVTQNMLLQTLSCTYNYLSSLDVTQSVSLVELFCQYNFITALDLSYNLKLITLNCGYNNLEGLDVSQNIILTQLHCEHNYLRCLNVSNGNNLNFTDLTTFFNNYLFCIQVDDEIWATANWNNTYGAIPGVSFNFNPQSTFSDNCNNPCGGLVTNISESTQLTDLKVFPNPFSSSATMEIPITADESFTLMVYDILGNKVITLDNITSDNITLEKGDLKEGLYFFGLSSSTQSYEGKLMIK